MKKYAFLFCAILLNNFLVGMNSKNLVMRKSFPKNSSSTSLLKEQNTFIKTSNHSFLGKDKLTIGRNADKSGKQYDSKLLSKNYSTKKPNDHDELLRGLSLANGARGLIATGIGLYLYKTGDPVEARALWLLFSAPNFIDSLCLYRMARYNEQKTLPYQQKTLPDQGIEYGTSQWLNFFGIWAYGFSTAGIVGVTGYNFVMDGLNDDTIKRVGVGAGCALNCALSVVSLAAPDKKK